VREQQVFQKVGVAGLASFACFALFDRGGNVHFHGDSSQTNPRAPASCIKSQWHQRRFEWRDGQAELRSKSMPEVACADLRDAQAARCDHQLMACDGASVGVDFKARPAIGMSLPDGFHLAGLPARDPAHTTLCQQHLDDVIGTAVAK